MFKGQPKGLFVLFFSNMGERFGYYTMLAIFALYLQDHFGWNETKAANVYGIFLAAIYFAPLLGGIIADSFLGYGKTVIIGIVVMALGYVLLAQPTNDPNVVYIALGVIALGVGLFKGNLVVIVGNLYDESNLGHLRDAAFNIFYMGINVGAFFAPHAANSIKNFYLEKSGFVYDSAIPKIANEFLAGSTPKLEVLQNFAKTTDPVALTTFSQNYLDALAKGYNWGFALAVISMAMSIVIFIAFRKHYKHADYRQKDKIKTGDAIELSPKQVKDRIVALLLVFLIVIFFWMAFHQNGSTLTFFAKNYTNLHTSKFTYMLFNIPALLSIFAIVLGGIFLFNKNTSKNNKIYSSIAAIAGISYIAYFWLNTPAQNLVGPELFQSFNPIFIVILTPVIVGIFASLNSKGKEPSAPFKIGIGMVITAIGFIVMVMASIGLPSVLSLNGNAVEAGLAVSPYWLISTYFTLTIAELFLSPMGLSFVSKVAPPKLKGSMQAGWLAATAIGNYLAGFVGRFYQNWELWQFFLMLVTLCIVSAIIMFSILKIIKRASTS
ncbi:MAG: MFS transporter [Bacteroidetes bacterium GWE2_29_8]|nr:MAG: MFS transporter [Bacteroidetes bacterium GWE2_29_8]OFY15894.1 MAG: MFS transporter [Bacteroidetes bacterium GWF2_29_10]